MAELHITWLTPDGRGAGTGPEGVVRVAGTIPGDRVTFSETGRRGRTVDATLDEIVQPSPDRQLPECPVWDSCGGCDLAQYAHTARLQALSAMVGHALRVDPPVVVPSPLAVHHRARVKLSVESGRLGYRAHRSHQLVAPEVCRIARKPIQPLWEITTAIAETGHLDGIRAIELRTDDHRVVANIEADHPPDSETRHALQPLEHVAWNGKALHGDPTLHLDVLGHRLRASPRSFYQVNLENNLALVQHVVDRVGEATPERILDLYAGIGNLTVPLAAATNTPVHAVELEGQSLQDLKVNAQGLPITAAAGRVERFDSSRVPFDVAVLDPPRAGAPGVLERLIRNRPRRIVYVSCNITSAARDLREVLRNGYSLVDVRCFDLFVETHHIETVLILDRQGRGTSRPRRRR